jgi:hypothetical protein
MSGVRWQTRQNSSAGRILQLIVELIQITRGARLAGVAREAAVVMVIANRRARVWG